MARTLVKNGYVVTVDPRRSVFPGGFVAIDGALISAVGPSERTPAADGFDEIIDASGAVVLPGLINMHQHHWYTLFKGLCDGYLLEDWVSPKLSVAPSPRAMLKLDDQESAAIRKQLAELPALPRSTKGME